MQSQPWRSQSVEQSKQKAGNHSLSSQGTSASIYATPFRPAKDSLTLQPSISDLPIELLSSPSRGVDKSDVSRDLTNAETQAKYRLYISERIKKHCDTHGALIRGKQRELFPISLPDISGHSDQKAAGVDGPILESLQDILLLVRRLREGCVAAGRQDAFAIDVYALSTFLSIIIAEEVQLSSSLPKLFNLLSSQSPEKSDYPVQHDLRSLFGASSMSSHIDIGIGMIAATYLLWLSVTGGQVARVGGASTYQSMSNGQWLQQRNIVMANLSEEERNSAMMKATESLHHALAHRDIITFRSLLLNDNLSIWQYALIRRSIDKLRDDVWNTLIASYLQVPIDGRLVEEGEKGDDWLERMLLIDIYIMPVPISANKHVPIVAVPDAWDDSVDHLADSLKVTTIGNDGEVLQVRANRLATIFDRYKLPSDKEQDDNGNLLSRWRSRKMIQGGLPHLRLR